MKLKAQIQLGLLAAFAFIAIVGVGSGITLQDNASSSKEALSQNMRTMYLTSKMAGGLGNLASIVSQDSLEVVSALSQMRSSMSDIKRSLKQQLKAIDDPEVVEQLSLSLDELDFDGQSATVLNIYVARDELLDKIETVEWIVGEMMEANRADLESKVAEINDTYTSATIIIIILGFVLFVMAAVAIFYVPEYIADPISTISQSMKDIMDKNYNSRINIKRNDEIGELAESFNNMAQKLEEYEGLNVQNLLLEKQRLENIINRVKEAIVGLDGEHKVLFVNQTFLDLVKISRSEIVGRSADKLMQRYSLFKKLFDNLHKREEETPGFQSIQVEENEKSLYYERELIELSLSRKRKTATGQGYIVLYKNITEFREHDIAKTNFMATLSHELKTPISAIDMSLSLLKDKRVGSLNEEQDSLAATIKQNTTRLLTLINEIMEVSKIETGNIIMVESMAKPEDIVNQALSATIGFIENKNIKLEKVIGRNLPEISVDLQKTSGVLINFISNAVRYTPDHGLLRIEIDRHGQDVEFRVSDNGKGISEEDLKNIFKRFKRAKDDKTKGTGLGLAISKEFIEKQGGRIWAKSKLGKGSTFGFALPME